MKKVMIVDDNSLAAEGIEKNIDWQSLDAEDIRVVRSIMLKYWKQLMKLSKLKLEKEKRGDVVRAASKEAVEVEVEEASDGGLLSADIAGADCISVCDLPPRDL